MMKWDAYIVVPTASCEECGWQCAWTKWKYTDTVIWRTRDFDVFHWIVIRCRRCRTAKQWRSTKSCRSKHLEVYKNPTINNASDT